MQKTFFEADLVWQIVSGSGDGTGRNCPQKYDAISCGILIQLLQDALTVA
jgi:hypothetical protein